MAGGSSLPAANFPDPREVNTEVGESSSTIDVLSEERVPDVPVLDWKKTAMKMKWPLPPRPRVRPPPPPRSRVNLTLDMAVVYELKHGHDLDPDMDNKTLRRIISNRLAAQRSRMRRSRRVTDLETKTDSLEGLLENLTPEVDTLQKTKQLLQEENGSLRTAVDVRADQLKIAERVAGEFQLEIIRLREHLANLNVNKDDGHGQIPEEVVMQMQMQMQEMAPLMESEPDDSLLRFINFDEDQEDEEVDQYLDPHPDL